MVTEHGDFDVFQNFTNRSAEYGFMTFDPNTGLCSVFSADSQEEAEEYWGCDEGWFDDVFALEVGESYDWTWNDQGIFTRIW